VSKLPQAEPEPSSIFDRAMPSLMLDRLRPNLKERNYNVCRSISDPANLEDCFMAVDELMSRPIIRVPSNPFGIPENEFLDERQP
jgi:hypothetical protein